MTGQGLRATTSGTQLLGDCLFDEFSINRSFGLLLCHYASLDTGTVVPYSKHAVDHTAVHSSCLAAGFKIVVVVELNALSPLLSPGTGLDISSSSSRVAAFIGE